MFLSYRHIAFKSEPQKINILLASKVPINRNWHVHKIQNDTNVLKYATYCNVKHLEFIDILCM